ncbi:C-type lectin domain family 2 member D-like isoform X2 [Podarcis raffonei]|uniref:C-type lectin domain family 2 member D-like isoform X2 n=1 Tax=Podarcis raffonei TaxID=65483 RepID=UPI0023299435|nr:C-type lectin domain family 2 member D-like isoform X2 [Podarcis raffonei]
MGFSEIEKTEQRLHMNPAVAENGEWPRIIINGSTKQAGELFSPKPGHFPHGRSAVLPTALPSPSTPTECCPDGWIGYQRKCYYFSDSDRNWTSSQNYCASFNASLVVIDSQEEMSFLRRYKGPADHWIGLQKMNDQGPWKWIDGSIFNNGFEIRGGGESAYINRQGVASSSRLSKERWICSKPVHRGERTLAVH